MASRATLFATIVIVCLLSVGLSGCTSLSTAPAYQLNQTLAPPKEVNDTMQGGPTVLLINQRGCPDCEKIMPYFADLQAQYTDVRFVALNIDDNKTSSNIASYYHIRATPTFIVLRSDGAFVSLLPYSKDNNEKGFDFSVVKRAIEDVRNWTATGHNWILDRIVSNDKEGVYKVAGQQVEAWNATWHDNNHVTILSTVLAYPFAGCSTREFISMNQTLRAFSTTQDATNYLNGLNKERYSLRSTNYQEYGGYSDYERVVGHDPQTYQQWGYAEGNHSSPQFKSYTISQYDNVIEFMKLWNPYENAAV